ncbi:hypothetical protein SGB_02690 [Shigella boydii ATCC 9905]|nr:hypothetical protein SGB_02690 [Shigella boydii ATCC 9905]
MGAIVARQDNFHKTSLMGRLPINSPSPKKETFQNFRISPSRSHFYTE